jgi:beta-mannosidase
LAIDVVPEIASVSAIVPGSVQQALLKAGQLPNWNIGLNSRACEWVENREWIFSTHLPRQRLPIDKPLKLNCLGLDGTGVVLLNSKTLGVFDNSFIPYNFSLPQQIWESDPLLEIVFTVPPRFLGTPNRSSEIRDWKPRFNYTWDWMPRNVQIGIWDDLTIEENDGPSLDQVRITTDAVARTRMGSISLSGHVKDGLGNEIVSFSLSRAEDIIWESSCGVNEYASGLQAADLPISLWYPNGMGDQVLYNLNIVLSREGIECDRISRRVGFKQVQWLACHGAPEGADHWVCEVNGESLFLAGVNWTPIRAHFADVPNIEYRKRIETYRNLNMNILRVWGGAYLEKECFYDLCDELGMLVWQEFPLSSSGPDNEPPYDDASLETMTKIGKSYVQRRRHHASLLMLIAAQK